MKILMQKSQRLREKDNKPFTDFYVGWVYEGKAYLVRVFPAFGKDFDKLCAVSVEVPVGELPEKYL